MRTESQIPNLWIPGMEPDPAALQRLKDHFRKPAQPMGEAWFMGERRFFTELMTQDSSQWELGLIESALIALASGPGCFGVLKEWTDWLHYLLPRLLERIEGWEWMEVYESLVTAFMARYPDERGEYPYAPFLEDVLKTLGRVPMSASNWKDGRLVARGLISVMEDSALGPFLSCGGTISVALFLHLKYLDEASFPEWLASVLPIDDPVWRFKIVLWISKSKDLLLQPDQQPGVLEFESSFGSGWQGSWCLMGGNPSSEVDPSQLAVPFLSDARRQLFREEIRRHLTCESLDRLDVEIAELERSQVEIYGIREQLEQASLQILQDYQLR